jgi:hypothetical protein
MIDDETRETIAIAIGYHFWKCTKDDEAADMAEDCMKDIDKALNQLSSDLSN